MTIAEIRGIEENRKDPAQQCVIHLMREGNFYHANDWSAWLMLNFPISKEPLTPTAKRLKDGYIHAFVGFPVTSLGKFVPDDVEFKAVTDTQIDVTTTADFGDATYEDLRSQVDAWKDGLLQEGESQLAAQVLCHAPGYSRILHAYSPQEAIADSHRLPAQDGYAQMPGREDMERCAGHGLPDMAYGNDSDAGPTRELHHCGRQVELDWTGPCEVDAPLGGRTGTPYWQPYVTAVLERLSKPIRPVCETRAEMQVLRTVCGRRHNSIARQGMAVVAGSQDTAFPERNTWAGPSHGKAADKRGTSWYRVPGQLYQTLQDVRVAQHPAAHREEDCLAGLHEATEDIAQCQFLPWYLPAYSLVQHQTQAVHERGIPENRCLRCRYD